MIKKKIVDFTEKIWDVGKGKKKIGEKRQEKIRQVEWEILSSRLKRQYQELGEFVFNSFKKNNGLNDHSVKLKKYLSTIKTILIEKKKLEK